MRKTFSWLIAIVIVVSMGLVLSGCTPPEGENGVKGDTLLSGSRRRSQGSMRPKASGPVRVWKSPKI